VKQQLETAIAERLGRLPPRVQRRLSRQPPVVIDGQRLAADVQLMLSLRPIMGEPIYDEHLSVETARRLTREEAATARPSSGPAGNGCSGALR